VSIFIGINLSSGDESTPDERHSDKGIVRK